MPGGGSILQPPPTKNGVQRWRVTVENAYTANERGTVRKTSRSKEADAVALYRSLVTARE
jgi:hypothetical protein